MIKNQNIIFVAIAIIALLFLLKMIPFPFQLEQKKESCCGVY